MSRDASKNRPENRLASESSPYLKQHAQNPVDWYPWGTEAFEKARIEGKPVFLSIGYSACHWCHVMERESFEDEDIARFLNEHFVSIKVDREERPDVDGVYMTAVQIMTGRGGWPLTAFLLPDKRPFFGGTYYPPDDRGGRLGFHSLLIRLAAAWKSDRFSLEASAERLESEIRENDELASSVARHPLDVSLLEDVELALKRSFDARFGGFGRAPKFPPHQALEWLLLNTLKGSQSARSMAFATLDAMALGGIHDHLAGGFHRYSTDERWLVPHFEKMLYDNAQLLASYARAFGLSGRPFYKRVALSTGEYLLSEMRGPEGAFHAATDADSEGEEGKYFVWSDSEILNALGEGSAFFSSTYQVRPDGNYSDEATGRKTGLNILHMKEEPSSDEDRRLAPLRARLKSVRDSRVPPGLDDKRLSGWNALAISGFAIASRILGEPRFLEAATLAAQFLLQKLCDPSGQLLRTWKDGVARIPAFLEDEAYFANALIDLSESSPVESAKWLELAKGAVHGIVDRFTVKGEPGFFFTGSHHEELLARGHDIFDKATPSAPGSATRALLRVALKTGDASLASRAREALEEAAGLIHRVPHGTETWSLALLDYFEFEKRFPEALKRSRLALSSSQIRHAAENTVAPVTLTVSVADRNVTRGSRFAVSVTIGVADGFYLQGEDGLQLEAWAGSDVRVEKIEVPPAEEVFHEEGQSAVRGFQGTLSVRVELHASARAATGERSLSVLARFRACGEGICEPEKTVAASLSFAVVAG